MNYPNTNIPFRVAELMVGFFRNTLTEAENNELNEWLKSKQENISTFDKIAEIAFRSNFEYFLNDRSMQNMHSDN